MVFFCLKNECKGEKSIEESLPTLRHQNTPFSLQITGLRRNEQIKGINRGHNTRSGRVSMNAVTNTSAEEKRSCRQSTGGSVTESPKCQQNKQIKRGNHGQNTQPGQSTRSIMCPEELVVAEKSVEKMDFMTIIGLARKKRHEKPGKGQTRKIIVPQRYR